MSLKRLLLAGVATLLLSTLALPAVASYGASSKPTIDIGSTNFEEQAIVSNLYGDVLQKAGYTVKVEPALGTRQVVVPALEKGQLDLEPDYAEPCSTISTAKPSSQPATTSPPWSPPSRPSWPSTGHRARPGAGRRHQRVRRDQGHRREVSPDHAVELQSRRIQAHLGRTAGVSPERRVREGSRIGLRAEIASFKSLDEAGPLSVAALKNGEVQVVELFSSDGTVVSNNFVALTDNKHLEPADHIIPSSALQPTRPVWPRHSTPCRPS